MPATKTPRTPEMLRLPASRQPVPTRTRVRTRRIPLVAYIVLLIALPVAVVGAARAAGWWVTNGHTVPATALGAPKVDRPSGQGEGNGQGGGAGQSAGTGQSAGSGNGGQSASLTSPQDVKGSMTIQQVVDAFPQVTAAQICEFFGLPADTSKSTQLKTLAQTGNGREVTELREWLETRTE